MPQTRPARVLCTLVLAGALVAAAQPAAAVSLRDLKELAKAGLSDDVLVALVEADDTEFNLDAPTILELRRAGISERVILAMLRKPAPAQPAAPDPPLTEHPGVEAPPAAPEPAVVVVQQPAPQRVIVVPWFIAAPRPHPHPGPALPVAPVNRGFGRFMNDGWVERPAAPPPAQ